MNYDNIERELAREIFKASHFEFFKAAYCQLHPNQPLDLNWHHKLLCDRLQQETFRITKREPRQKDLIINVPFRSTKSVLVTVIWPVWSWVVDPLFKFINVSYSGDLAVEHSGRSKDLINSQWFQWLFGDQFKIRHDLSGKQFYENTKGGYRKAVGTGGQITGSGGDCVLCDDPQNPQKAASEVERKNTIDYYDHTLYSRLNDPEVGVRIIVQQRLHEEDLTGHLLAIRPDDHEHINIPGEITNETKATVQPQSLLNYYQDGLFWPSRFSRRILLSYQRALGSLQYAGQINQLPAPAEGVIIKRKWVPIVSPETVMRNPEAEPIHFFVDSAYTAKKQDCPSAIGAGFVRQNKLYIINMTQVWLEFPELCKFIEKYAILHGYSNGSKIKIEPKANGKSIVQQLKSITQLNVMEAKSPTDDKVTRLHSSSPVIESGRVCCLQGSWNDQFLDQVCSQPNSKYWDQTDVMNMMIEDLLGYNNFDFMFI